MFHTWNSIRTKAVTALFRADSEAIEYYTHRDILEEDGSPSFTILTIPEVQTILKKQRTDGSWKGPVKKTPVYPVNHSDLVATFRIPLADFDSLCHQSAKVFLPHAAECFSLWGWR